MTAIRKATTDKDFDAGAYFLSFMKFYEELAPVLKNILK